MIVTAGLLLAGCSSANNAVSPAAPKPAGFKEVVFDAADHHKVYADFYPAAKPDGKKVVLMFHQAGSNAGEYETIAPQINALGFDCIAVDQRSGGDMWGRSNRTAAKSGEGQYLDAFNDLEGAVTYAVSSKYDKVIVWGSSYSASLVLKLAPTDAHIKAVVTFSPGEYMDDKSVVKSWASKVNVPVFFACTTDELQDGRQEIYDAIPSKSKTLVAIPGGVHGSSTLIPDKSKAAGLYMAKVKAFLYSL